MAYLQRPLSLWFTAISRFPLLSDRVLPGTFPKFGQPYLINSIIDVDVLDDDPHAYAFLGLHAEVKPWLFGLQVFDIADGFQNVLAYYRSTENSLSCLISLIFPLSKLELMQIDRSSSMLNVYSFFFERGAFDGLDCLLLMEFLDEIITEIIINLFY